MERRWTPSELSGGRFCEIVYTVLVGYAKGTYPSSPSKPSNFVDACRQIENCSHIPRSFQILIPRLLPALYEIRNNRNVGHVGGEVDPDFMDSSIVVSIASWVLAELIRVIHNISTEEAQKLVESLTERRHPLVWKSEDKSRVLDPKLSLKVQILLLLVSASGRVLINKLFSDSGSRNRSYFNLILRNLHDNRLLEIHDDEEAVEILPPGSNYITGVLRERNGI